MKLLLILLMMTSVVMAHHTIRSQKVTNYGDSTTAIYHARIQECGTCDGISIVISEIIEGCDIRYHGQFYFTVSKDDSSSCICYTSTGVITKGNLDMSIEKMDDSGL